jgi:hypothetical protein
VNAEVLIEAECLEDTADCIVRIQQHHFSGASARACCLDLVGYGVQGAQSGAAHESDAAQIEQQVAGASTDDFSSLGFQFLIGLAIQVTGQMQDGDGGRCPFPRKRRYAGLNS